MAFLYLSVGERGGNVTLHRTNECCYTAVSPSLRCALKMPYLRRLSSVIRLTVCRPLTCVCTACLDVQDVAVCAYLSRPRSPPLHRWFQYKVEHDEDIGFHFDKDEAVASDEMRMVLPTLSTVTYLSDVGGPTLIFNQTTLNGNMNVPLIPESGALFFPEVRTTKARKEKERENVNGQ